ncbi:50S ribosomal protein L15 [Candidatus Peregrinibacteria bacterium CG08_land_8_20_14_0_20_41_10]|nr:MAG: 50S ribosomal protein L15 [Candidatus Peregrinibacteria bacterium CG1_02_41_10]PIS32213.1 MAG: 50S ribosomal protein L15 [Candidatus Peregrinibacteria bacterium CG08_land_8_20_14_0_20_41_10]
MQQHSLKVTAHKKHRRVGRGNASGHGNYSGRGCNGQGQHDSHKVRVLFEGGQTPLMMKLPKLKGFKFHIKTCYQVVNLEKLNLFPENTKINPEKLEEKGLIRSLQKPVKILGRGKLEKKLQFENVSFSETAKKQLGFVNS